MRDVITTALDVLAVLLFAIGAGLLMAGCVAESEPLTASGAGCLAAGVVAGLPGAATALLAYLDRRRT